MVAIKNIREIEVKLTKLTEKTPELYREYLYKVLKEAEKETKQRQTFEGTLLVDNSPRKPPTRVNLNGQLALVDQVDMAGIYKDAETYFYTIAPVGKTGGYKEDVRWLVGKSLQRLPLTTEPRTAIFTNISAYTRRMEFGKKETNVFQLRIRKRRGCIQIKKKIKKRWVAEALKGVLLVVYKLLTIKYKGLIKSGKIYIQFKKLTGVAGEGGLDTYPGIIIGRKK